MMKEATTVRIFFVFIAILPDRVIPEITKHTLSCRGATFDAIPVPITESDKLPIKQCFEIVRAQNNSDLKPIGWELKLLNTSGVSQNKKGVTATNRNSLISQVRFQVDGSPQNPVGFSASSQVKGLIGCPGGYFHIPFFLSIFIRL